jgi:UDP-glucose 4-epimerase
LRSLNRALVVGGAGFYGGWLVDALIGEGIETVVLDERSAAHLPHDVEVIDGDAVELDLGSIVDDHEIDAVFQLAGSGTVPQTLRRPLDDARRNTLTTLAVLEAVRGATRTPMVAFVSSAAVYGEGETMPMREDHPRRPVSPYGISKLAAEQYVSLYWELYAIPGFSVRPFSLYGPGQRKLVIYDLLTRIARDESPLVVAGRPEVSRDFVFVGDAAAALVTLARAAPAQGEAYNLASGSPTTLGELVDALLEAAGSRAETRFTGELRPGDPLRWDGDPSLARKLGVSCDTSLRDGLRRTADWVSATLERHAHR